MIRRGEYYSPDLGGHGGGPQVDVAAENVELKPGEGRDLLNVENGKLEGEMETGRFVARSNRGLKRKRNEDCCAVTPNAIVVADGMGGHEDGDMASRTVTQSIVKSLGEGVRFNPYTLWSEINKDLLELAKLKKHDTMATTVASVEIKENTLRSMTVGDSRVYIFDKKGGLKFVSMESSVIQGILFKEADAMKRLAGKKRLTKDEISRAINERERELRREKESMAITDWIGADDPGPGDVLNRALLYRISDEASQLTEDGRLIDFKDVDDQVVLSDDDIVLVCSDGLSGAMSHVDLTKIVSKNCNDIVVMSDVLMMKCFEGGAQDNITMAIYQHGKKK